MSTKSSIKWKDQDESPGYHLYHDLFDDMHQEYDRPVYLRLDGVQIVELYTQNGGGASLTVTIPTSIARELGLLKVDARDAAKQEEPK